MSTTLYTVAPVTKFSAAGYDIVQAGTVVPDGVVWAIQSAAFGAGVTLNTSAGGAPQLVQVPSYYNGGTGSPVGDSLPVGAEVKDSTGAVFEKTPGGWIVAGAQSGTFVAQGALVVSVKDAPYGAKGNGTTDDTAAIQSAINAVGAAGGGTVYFPPGTYKVTSGVRASATTNNAATDGHALTISASNIRLLGAGRNNTKISHRANGGADPATTYQTVGGNVWRGAGIFIVSGTHDTTISDLELTGNAGYTGSNTFPANPATGDGWDLTHKGIWLSNNGTFDNTLIERCHVHHYRGEIVYGGGNTNGRVTLRDSEVHDTNGDCWSVSGETTVERSRLYKTAGHGIEDAYLGAPAIYRNNHIHDCDLAAVSMQIATGNSEPFGPCIIAGNLIRNCLKGAITAPVGARNLLVEDNVMVDCASATGGTFRSIYVNTQTSSPLNDVTIRRNTVWANAVSMTSAPTVAIYDGASAGMNGITVEDNLVALTAAGAAAGKTVNQGYDFTAISDAKATIRNNRSRGTIFQYTDQAVVKESLLTGTAYTVVAKRRPDRMTAFLVNVYYRVVTAATNVTIYVTWYDATGVQQTFNILPTASKPTGSYVMQPVLVLAQGANESQYVQVGYQAGTANQVYASASITEVG